MGVASFDRVRELESQLLQADDMRRQMHNMIQELRGNVRVIARVRPLLPAEDNVVDVPDVDKQTLAVSIPELDPRLFHFDRVFNEYASKKTCLRKFLTWCNQPSMVTRCASSRMARLVRVRRIPCWVKEK